MAHTPQLATLDLEPLGSDGYALRVTGELDISNRIEFEAALAALEYDEPKTALIDLSRVDFIDSRGLRALAAARERALTSGRDLEIRANAKTLMVLERTHLNHGIGAKLAAAA